MKKKLKGFTLVELLVTMVIITILAMATYSLTGILSDNQRKDSFKDQVYAFSRQIQVEDYVNGDFNITDYTLYKGNDTDELLDRETFINLVLKLQPSLLASDDRNFCFLAENSQVEFIYVYFDYIYVANWNITTNKVSVVSFTEKTNKTKYDKYVERYKLEANEDA